MRRVCVALVITTMLVGCGDSGSQQLGKKDDAELRGNFNRPLNPNELSQMGGANANAGKAAPPPAKGK